MKRIVAIVAALALIGAVGYAIEGSRDARAAESQAPAQEHEHHMGAGPMGGMMGEMMSGSPMRGHAGERPLITQALKQREQLGLSGEQVAALEKARAEFEQDARQRQAEIQAAERQLGELLRADEVDLPSVEAKVQQISRLQANLRLARIKTLEKGKAILTAEQRKKLLSEAPAGDGMMSGRGAEEMQRFMNSERAPKAMAAMMDMARGMGDGDIMLGMVRMMEMMGSMGGMMGGQGDGMMGGSPRHPGTPQKAE
jgi:Spy/CpxP family protein refolding chaperone